VAHNYYVPHQLVLTSSTAALGHSYWESRLETHLGERYPRTAKSVILQDHAVSDAHLDAILSPTLFSMRTNRRLFRGMVHLTENQSWQWVFQLIAENSRWDLPPDDVERHMAVAFEYVMAGLSDDDAPPHRLDPAGDKALGLAKQMRRRALQEGGRTDPERIRATAEEHFGLPDASLDFWRGARAAKPWREEAVSRPIAP